MHVVRPGEIDCEIVAGQTQRGLGHRCGRFVDDVIKALPALVGLVGVNVQHHPQRVGVGGDLLVALRQEIHVVVIPCHACADDVIAPGVLGVVQAAVAVRIAVARVPDIGGVVRGDRCPLFGTLAQVNGSRLRRRGNGAGTLVAADVIDQQIVVVVPEVAACRLQVARELIVALVGEGIFDRGGGAFYPCLITSGGPLVPSGDEHDLRIDLQCIIKLFGEVVAPQCCRCAFLLVPILIGGCIGASHDVIAVHGSQQTELVVMVHRHADRDLLRLLLLLEVP